MIDKLKVIKEWFQHYFCAFFFGGLGIHRFYVGKVGTGILMIVTAGGLGIWVIVDFVMICTGSFKDKEGKDLQRGK